MTASLVSVIIPVFDGERTIRDCLRSVASQTHSNLEIIVINDGSHDATEDIVRALAEEDERIHLIVSDNQGVSAARNRGLAAASGEWVMFVDADDAFADPLLVEAVVRAGEGADLVGYGVRRQTEAVAASPRRPNELRGPADSLGLIVREARDVVLDAESVAGMVLDESANALWDKAYRRSLIMSQECSFSAGIRMGEDLLFNIKCLRGAGRMRILPIDGYLYRCGNSDSATRRYLPDKFADLMHVNDELRAWARASGSLEFIGAAEYIRAKNVLSCMRDLHHRDCDLPRRCRLRAARQYRANVPTVDTRGLSGGRRMLCLAYNFIGFRPMFHLAGLAGSLR